MTTDYRARVHRGAALLDERESGWWERVSGELDMADCERCVLGYLYGDYHDGLVALGLAGRPYSSADFGFNGFGDACRIRQEASHGPLE